MMIQKNNVKLKVTDNDKSNANLSKSEYKITSFREEFH